MDSLQKKNILIFIQKEKNILKFSNTNEIDLCSNCYKHKAVLTNVTYEFFDENFKFYPVCLDCFDIDEFNRSVSMFLGQGHYYFGKWVPGERPKIFFKDQNNPPLMQKLVNVKILDRMLNQ